MIAIPDFLVAPPKQQQPDFIGAKLAAIRPVVDRVRTSDHWFVPNGGSPSHRSGQRLTDKLLEGHLDGRYRVGACLIERGSNTCRLALFDLDAHKDETLAAVAAGMDENAVKDMSLVLGQAKSIGEATGATVVVIHHSNKGGGLRGSTALLGAADSVLGVENDGKGGRTLLVEKQKDGEAGAAFAFRLRPVVLGVDEDLNEMSSCVVEPVDDVAQAAGGQKGIGIKLPPLRGTKRDVYDAVVALGGGDGAEISLDEVRGHLKTRVQNEGGEFRPTRISEAIQKLVEDGTLLLGTGALPTLRFPPPPSLAVNDGEGGGP